MTKERLPGVDLAKIVAIFLVMILHVTNALDVQTGNLPLSYVHMMLNSLSSSCIDLFALATGFLCVNSTCRYSRISSLWVSTVFWGITALLFSQFCLGYSIPFKYYINALFPVWRDQYWFFTAYFMLFFFMPCLNRSVKNMSQSEFMHLFVAIGIFICGYSFYSNDPFILRSGFSFAWLSIVYLMGAYLRVYPPRKINPIYCFLFAVLISFVTCLRQLLSILIGFRIPGDRFRLISYLSPFTLGIAIMIFLGCINMPIGEKAGRFFKTMAATTFGIYLMHVQPFVWQHVWPENLHNVKANSPVELLALVLLIASGFFICFSLLEYCRLKLFSKFGVDSLIRKIDNYVKR